MTDEQLRLLWEPTFSAYERVRLFYNVPKVLYLANVVVQLVVTFAFTALQQLNQLSPQYEGDPIVNTTLALEIFILIYFVSCLFREFLQMRVSSTFIEYITDIWNCFDVGSILFYVTGLYVRRVYQETGNANGFPDTVKGGEDALFKHTMQPLVLGDYWTGITWWKFCYGCSLFFLWLRFLRILSIFRSLGILVLVIFKMLRDMPGFLVVFCIFTFSFSSLLYGAGNPDGVIDKCHLVSGDPEMADYSVANCLSFWWFLRTLLQGFGELYLEEMTNVVAVMVAIAAFVILNVVLMNLLIAMMSGTYEDVNNQANRQIMLDRYDIIKEHSRWAPATPPFFNLVLIPDELITFTLRYDALSKKYQASSFWGLLDIYLVYTHTHLHMHTYTCTYTHARSLLQARPLSLFLRRSLSLALFSLARALSRSLSFSFSFSLSPCSLTHVPLSL